MKQAVDSKVDEISKMPENKNNPRNNGAEGAGMELKNVEDGTKQVIAKDWLERLRHAVKSGQLKFDKTFSITRLATVLVVDATVLRREINKRFGSATNFKTQIGISSTADSLAKPNITKMSETKNNPALAGESRGNI